MQYLGYDIRAFAGPAALPPGPAGLRAAAHDGLVVRLVAALQRVPYVYYAADVWSDAAASTGALAPLVSVLRKIESWVLRGASAVLAVSTGVADQLHGLGVDPQKVVVVGNGIDTSTFTPRVRPSRRRPQLRLHRHHVRVAGRRRLHQGAGPPPETHPGARLVFLGQGRRPT